MKNQNGNSNGQFLQNIQYYERQNSQNLLYTNQGSQELGHAASSSFRADSGTIKKKNKFMLKPQNLLKIEQQ